MLRTEGRLVWQQAGPTGVEGSLGSCSGVGCCYSLRQNHCGKLGKKHTVPLHLHFLGYQTVLSATKGRSDTTQTSTVEACPLQATLSCLLSFK